MDAESTKALAPATGTTATDQGRRESCSPGPTWVDPTALVTPVAKMGCVPVPRLEGWKRFLGSLLSVSDWGQPAHRTNAAALTTAGVTAPRVW